MFSTGNTNVRYSCYEYTQNEKDEAVNKDKDKEVCGRHQGFVFIPDGNDSLAPGCGKYCPSNCCQPTGTKSKYITIF